MSVAKKGSLDSKLMKTVCRDPYANMASYDFEQRLGGWANCGQRNCSTKSQELGWFPNQAAYSEMISRRLQLCAKKLNGAVIRTVGRLRIDEVGLDPQVVHCLL